jgi:RNA polymerase sigma-70 factor (ECF subfamily)
MTPIPEKAQVREADPDQWAGLYEQFSRPIYYLALRLLGNPTQAEDATHDVFLKAYQARAQFHGESSLKTWLYRIAINHCHSLLRSWYNQKVQTNADDYLLETAPAAEDKPFRVLELKELGRQIQRTLDALPAEYRVLLLLLADEEMSYEEIARLTNQGADAVRGKLYRARKAFAIAFHKQEGSPP